MKFEDKGPEIQPSNNPKLIKVLAQEQTEKFRSMSDLYNNLRFKQKLFLPSFGEAKLIKSFSFKYCRLYTRFVIRKEESSTGKRSCFK